MSTPLQESLITLGSQKLAVKIYGDANLPSIIALHGWCDNAASFDLLAPMLSHVRIIAVDLPGHGFSSSRNSDAGYYIWSNVADVMAVADYFQLEKFSLLGHSMGGAIATLLAALFPSRINKLLLLDAVGPLSTSQEDAPNQMLRALEQLQTLKPDYHNHYADFGSAVNARAEKGLTQQAATILGKRGIVQDELGYYWNLDARLQCVNLLSLTEEQVAVFIRQIQCACLLIAAPAYWHGNKKAWFDQRCTYFHDLVVYELPGGHHQHLEGQVEAVAALINNFLGY